jgi:hypothetical protein
MQKRFKRGPCTAAVLAAAAAWAAAGGGARAQEITSSGGETGMIVREDPSLSLDPTTPQVGAMAGGTTPSFGQKSLSEGDWRFDFHGFLTAPLTMGFNTRINPMPGQNKLVLHAPPVVPDDLETWSHTGVTPTTYAQINFSEGNSIVTGNVSIVAKQANVSESFLEPADQLGITDVFLSITPPVGGSVKLQALLGAFTTRYGSPGEYDEGRYGTPIIARINGVGEQVSLRGSMANKLTFVVEEGFHGQTNKASASITPDVWNNFADPGQGSTFVGHLHAGVGYARMVTVGGHVIHAFSQDDRAGADQPDGRIDVYAGDVRANMGRFGHLYGAFAYTNALQSRSVSRIVSVLNTQGGKGLMDNYLGDDSNGTGTLTTIGGQYDLSIGRLVSYPVPFYGDGPDLFVSVFGMQTHVTSPQPANDNVTKRKFGMEATYSVLSWLAFSGRFDYVSPFQDTTGYNFAVVSPRVIFRTDWQATDQLVLQYSHWFDSQYTVVRVGDPPMEDPNVRPDKDMITLSASMWW